MGKAFDIENVRVGGGAPIFVVAGPCALESKGLAEDVCGKVKEIAAKLGIGFIFKSSYDKANRQSIESFRGPGLEEGLRILQSIRTKFNVPFLTDVHSPFEAERVGAAADVIQLPAFLNRQTDLAVACGKTGKPVFVKKAQFMSPQDMQYTARKIEHGGSDRIGLVERGTTFGYNDLVVDMRSIAEMRKMGYPVVFDCTHSVQKPGAAKGSSGGSPMYIEPLARAAAGCGIDGIFIETHPDCSKALCDAATMLPLDRLENLLESVLEIDEVVKKKIIND